jgi:hypothetical protein
MQGNEFNKVRDDMLAEQEHAEEQDERERPDFRDFNKMGAGKLAKEIWAGAWGSPPDRHDRRYSRCCVAAEYALADLWDQEHVSVAAGEPVEPAADALGLFRRVDAFAYHKLSLYHAAIGEGISTSDWRWNNKLARKAALRAVAVVCGLPAAEDAERRFIAWEQEEDERRRAEWEGKAQRGADGREVKACYHLWEQAEEAVIHYYRYALAWQHHVGRRGHADYDVAMDAVDYEAAQREASEATVRYFEGQGEPMAAAVRAYGDYAPVAAVVRQWLHDHLEMVRLNAELARERREREAEEFLAGLDVDDDKEAGS